MTGMPAMTIYPKHEERAGTCPTCHHALYWVDAFGDRMKIHNPPGCPNRIIRGRMAKDWTEADWEAERAKYPKLNLRPWR